LKIWLLFASDIQAVKQELVEERNESPSNTPYFSGRALSLKLKSKRLEATRQRLLETKWAGHCGISCKVCHQQEMLVGSISETIFRLYHEWMDDIGDNPKSRLDRYLMRRSDDKPGLLESNLDPNLVNLCREANYWQNLGFQIPIYVQMIYDKWDTLQFVSESVLMLVRAYNRILDG
ncbi:GSCOCG00008326001-RA-CDS, partial [Cotesia congregata]